jgi:glucose-1-phosphate adenylyltransferase
VLTQFLSVSLHRHIRGTYGFDHFSGGFVEILAAQQTIDTGADWYQGTADAVRKTLRYLTQPGVDRVVILSGDQLYRMDFQAMLKTHNDSGADVTIASKPIHGHEATGLGVMRIDESGRVVGFVEKPKTEEELAPARMDPAWIDSRGIESNGREFLCNMGIYVFNTDVPLELLTQNDHQDFGREVFPNAIGNRLVNVHLFDGYWEDIGTISSFFDANLELAHPIPPFDLTSAAAPIYSRPRFLPPTRVDGASIRNSLVADGCVIQPGANIENSIIGLRCRIGKDVTIRNSVLLGADFYESPDQLTAGQLPLAIGDGAVIDGAIVDKNCRIGSSVQIVNRKNVDEGKVGESCTISDGILVVEKGSVLENGWHA